MYIFFVLHREEGGHVHKKKKTDDKNNTSVIHRIIDISMEEGKEKIILFADFTSDIFFMPSFLGQNFLHDT